MQHKTNLISLYWKSYLKMRLKFFAVLPLFLFLSACRTDSSPEDCDTASKGSMSICQKLPYESLSNGKGMNLPIHLGGVKITQFTMGHYNYKNQKNTDLTFYTKVENASSKERDTKFDFCNWRSAAVKLTPSNNFYLVNCKQGVGTFKPGETGEFVVATAEVLQQDYKNSESIELCLKGLGCIWWDQN